MIKTIGVVVLTLNAEKHLARCLNPILQSPLHPRVLVVDSSSTDGTITLAKQLGVEVQVISRKNFNHGKTREWARKQLMTDIVVMLTQDAHATNPEMLEILTRPLVEGKASLAYARQIPHEEAGFFESFPRDFNYPSVSEIRSFADIKSYGSHTFFCSDSCAAYLNSALDEVQGFRHVLLGEDTLAAAELLKKGHKIAYVAEAQVKHSHNYTLKQEFCRYFDTGLMRRTHENLLKCQEGDQKRGGDFARSMIKRLVQENPLLIPYACLHLLTKWLGYQLGKKSHRAPCWWKRTFSSQKYYWEKNASS